MKNAFIWATIGFSMASVVTPNHGRAGVIFSDDFASGPSPLWANETGAWTASGGGYYATAPNNLPNAYSSVPYSLTNFTVGFRYQRRK